MNKYGYKKKILKVKLKILKVKFKILKVKLKILKVKLKLAKQNLLKIKKEKDTLIYLFFYLKHILAIIQKKIISDIKQLINNLYDNKQITNQVYNNLIKTITYKNDS